LQLLAVSEPLVRALAAADAQLPVRLLLAPALAGGDVGRKSAPGSAVQAAKDKGRS
jgi:hypothetical protein